jgi:hypothetical protein
MKRTFKIIIPISLVVLLVVFFVTRAVKSHRSYKTRLQIEKAQKEQIESNVILAIENLIKQHNAFEWAKEIEDRSETLSFAPVLTVELEKLWLNNRPTFFIGIVKDVQTLDQEYYLLRLQGFGAQPLSHLDYELELKCPRHKVKSLIGEHPNVINGYKSGVAVVASIEEIKTTMEFVNEGENRSLRIGKGKCIDMVYMDDIWIWRNHQ